MNSKFRWGIFGTGFAARKFVFGLKQLPDAEVVAIGSRSTDHARDFANGFGFDAFTGSYEEVARLPDVDAVYIATPPSLHLEHSILCLNSKKPILVEKPLACSRQEAIMIKEASETNDVFCMEAMWSRFLPIMKYVRRMVNDNAIGKVRMITGSFGMKEASTENNHLFDAQLGGGALLDRAVYPISLAIYLMGKPHEVSGNLIMGSTGVDEQAAVTLSFGDECLAQFQASLIANTTNDFLISGSEANICLHPPIFRPFRLSVSPVQTTQRSGLKTPTFKENIKENHWVHQAYQRLYPLVSSMRRKSVKTLPYSGNGYHYQVMEVMECIRAGKKESELMPLDDSIAVLQVIDKIRSNN